MDIEMINKFLTVVISAVILSASGYANIASATVIMTKYVWSAVCYDCANGNVVNVRPDNSKLWKEVTGSITLSDYTLGDDITSANFISFAYTGVSQFLPMFTVGTGESFDFTTQDVKGRLYANADLTLELKALNSAPAPLEPEYSEVPTVESLVGSHYNADYEGTLIEELLWCDVAMHFTDDKDECNHRAIARRDAMVRDISTAQAEMEGLLAWNAKVKLSYESELSSYINVISVSVSPIEWNIGRYAAESFDIGSGFVVLGLPPIKPANQVSAPATLAIFALGIMGLGLRRIKKQS
jgi:hypothetical protein